MSFGVMQSKLFGVALLLGIAFAGSAQAQHGCGQGQRSGYGYGNNHGSMYGTGYGGAYGLGYPQPLPTYAPPVPNPQQFNSPYGPMGALPIQASYYGVNPYGPNIAPAPTGYGMPNGYAPPSAVPNNYYSSSVTYNNPNSSHHPWHPGHYLFCDH